MATTIDEDWQPVTEGAYSMFKPNQDKQAVLLIDVANCRDLDFGQMLHIARQHGQLVVTRAYADFANTRDLGEAPRELYVHGVLLVHCPAWPNGSGKMKSTTDEKLINDALALLVAEDGATTFIIASGDGHFVPTLCEIKKRGKKAIVMTGAGRVSDMLGKAADEVVLLSPVTSPVPTEVFQALVEATRLLQKAQRSSVVYAARVKEKMRELLPGFDEKEYQDRKNRPFKQFSEFLKEAQSQDRIRLIRQGSDILVTTVSERTRAA